MGRFIFLDFVLKHLFGFGLELFLGYYMVVTLFCLLPGHFF